MEIREEMFDLEMFKDYYKVLLKRVDFWSSYDPYLMVLNTLGYELDPYEKLFNEKFEEVVESRGNPFEVSTKVVEKEMGKDIDNSLTDISNEDKKLVAEILTDHFRHLEKESRLQMLRNVEVSDIDKYIESLLDIDEILNRASSDEFSCTLDPKKDLIYFITKNENIIHYLFKPEFKKPLNIDSIINNRIIRDDDLNSFMKEIESLDCEDFEYYYQVDKIVFKHLMKYYEEGDSKYFNNILAFFKMRSRLSFEEIKNCFYKKAFRRLYTPFGI